MDNRRTIRENWTKRWKQAHPDAAKFSQYKSYTKNFILKLAGKKDLASMQKRVDDARKRN